MTDENMVPMLCHVSPEMYDTVRVIADEEDRSMASIVRLALRAYLEAEGEA